MPRKHFVMSDEDKQNAARLRANNDRINQQRASRAEPMPRLNTHLDPASETVIRDGMSYSAYLQTDHWKRIRKTALANARNRCESCGIGYRLEIHHVTYDRVGQEGYFDVMVVCRECHRRIHGLY